MIGKIYDRLCISENEIIRCGGNVFEENIIRKNTLIELKALIVRVLEENNNKAKQLTEWEKVDDEALSDYNIYWLKLKKETQKYLNQSAIDPMSWEYHHKRLCANKDKFKPYFEMNFTPQQAIVLFFNSPEFNSNGN